MLYTDRAVKQNFDFSYLIVCALSFLDVILEIFLIAQATNDWCNFDFFNISRFSQIYYVDCTV